jgi:uncharacterized phosphatase
MTRFFLVRHGETEWNRLRKIQGVSDIPLNDTGRAQAAALGDILSRHRFDLIVSSPLSRALETARIVATKLGMPATPGNPRPHRAQLRRGGGFKRC